MNKSQLFILFFALCFFSFSYGQQGIIQLPATGQTISYYPGDDGDLQIGVPIPSSRFTDNGDGSVTDLFTGLLWSKDANLIATRDPSFDQDRTSGDGDVNWNHALDYIQLLNSQNYLGHNDWRLPNVNELHSLIEYSEPYTGLPVNHPFIGLKEGYWSSTTSDYYKWAGIMVFLREFRVHANSNLPPGHLEGFNKKLDTYSPAYYKGYVLPVRDGESPGIIHLPMSGQKNNYYSGDDGERLPGTYWPTPRLVDNRDKTVTDRLTGLMWTQDANVMLSRDPGFAGHWGRVQWTDALDYIAKLNNENYLGYNDWRLPNRIEMQSLLDFGRNQLTLPEGHPFIHAEIRNDSSSLYCWTSTTLARNADTAFAIWLSSGISQERPKNVETYLWPVRTDSSPLPSGSIHGVIDGTGIPGGGIWVTIHGPVNAWTKTNSSGYYEFSSLPNGNYSVEPGYWYYSFTPLSRLVTVTDLQVTADFTAAFNRAYGWTDISHNLYPMDHGAGANLVGMHFINENEGWITCSECIFHTSDGGQTFEEQSTLDYCNTIFMFDENEGWAGGNNGFIYHTTDGGDNWQLTNFMGPSCLDISFAPGSTMGFCCGSTGQLWKIGPGLFEQVITGLSGDMSSVEALSSTEALFCGAASSLYHYNGSGVTALLTHTTTPYSIDLFNDQLGWVVGGEGEIDGFMGLSYSWPELYPPLNITNYYDINSPNGKDVWAVGAYGNILHSPNGNDFLYTGSNTFVNSTVWNSQADGLNNAALWKVFFSSPVNGYAVGENGAILKYSLLEGAPAGADILGFSISQQLGTSMIDPVNLTVNAEVSPAANLSSLIPELFLSAGAACNPPSGVSQDFTSPVEYVVTSADGSLQQTWTVTVRNYTGINENRASQDNGEIKVFPNPVHSRLQIEDNQTASALLPRIQNIEVIDIFGKTLKTITLEPCILPQCRFLQKTPLAGGQAGPGTLELDISTLPAGIYLVQLSVDNQIIVKKIVKL